MKSLLLLATAAVIAAVPAAALVPGGTLTNSRGGDGTIDFVSSARFDILGGAGGISDNFTTYGTTASAARTISGQFRYLTRDLDTSRFDPAGYYINGDFTQLSIDFIPQHTQNFGTFSFTVAPGDDYGFYVLTTDGLGGRGILTIGAIPEPASWAMLIAGFGLVGAVLRRRRLAVPAA